MGLSLSDPLGISSKPAGGGSGGPISAPKPISFTAYTPQTATNPTPNISSSSYDPSNPFANGVGASGDPYNQLRNSANQTAENNEAQGLDAITRRFAAMGGGNSGAQIQAIQDLNRNAAQEKQNAIGNINVAEQQQALPYAQLEQQGSEFQQGQGLAQQNLGEQSREFGANLQLGENQQQLDTAANNINAELGSFQLNHSGGMFGSGGFLGLGNGLGGQSPLQSFSF